MVAVRSLMELHKRKYNRPKGRFSAEGKDPNNDAGSDVYQDDFLYDLHADPHELTNLAGFETFAEVSSMLRERLVQRMVEAGEQAPTILPAPSKPGRARRVSIEDLRTRV